MATFGEELEDEGVCGADPPMDEKFHLPLGSLSIMTWGFSMLTSVTLTCWEKIRGIISTPTFTLLAVRNGVALNLGSSAMERSSMPSEPVMSERLKLPSCTLRPSAVEALASMVGLNLFTGMRKGTTSRITISTTMTMAIHLTAFMGNLRIEGRGGRRTQRVDNITALGCARHETGNSLERDRAGVLYKEKPNFMVGLGRLELPTYGLGNRRSIHLSYSPA